MLSKVANRRRECEWLPESCEWLAILERSAVSILSANRC